MTANASVIARDEAVSRPRGDGPAARTAEPVAGPAPLCARLSRAEECVEDALLELAEVREALLTLREAYCSS